jgi:hypothetical protein
MIKIMVMVVIDMVMIKCSGLEKGREKRAQGKGDIYRPILFW